MYNVHQNDNFKLLCKTQESLDALQVQQSLDIKSPTMTKHKLKNNHMSDRYKARIQGFVYQQTHEPKRRFDYYTHSCEQTDGLVTKKIQPVMKYGSPTNAMGLIGNIIKHDTTPTQPNSCLRSRDSSKDRHDFFQTNSRGSQPFSQIKKIESPKLPSKFKKTEISPVMINTNLSPTTTDLHILSKYLNKTRHKDINNEIDGTKNGKQKTHYVGATSIYIGQEPSMRQKKKVNQCFDVAKTEGMMDTLIIAASRPSQNQNIQKIRQFINPKQERITHQDYTQGVLQFVNHFRSIKNQSHVLKRGEDIQRRMQQNKSLHSVASKTFYCRKIMKSQLNSLNCERCEQRNERNQIRDKNIDKRRESMPTDRFNMDSTMMVYEPAQQSFQQEVRVRNHPPYLPGPFTTRNAGYQKVPITLQSLEQSCDKL